MCSFLQFGATVLALSKIFGMKLNLAACLHSKSIYIMLKSMNTIYRELVLIYVLNMHGLKCLNQSHLVLFLVDFAVLTAHKKYISFRLDT